LSNLNTIFKLATGFNYRSSPRVATTMRNLHKRFVKREKTTRPQADLIKLFKYIAGLGATEALDGDTLARVAALLFLIDVLGRIQAVRGLPLIGDNAYFCKMNGEKCAGDKADQFKFRLQGQKTVKSEWTDWMTITRTRKTFTSLSSSAHRRTCTVHVLATLIARAGSSALQSQPQSFPRTKEFDAYGSSFFVYVDKSKRVPVPRVMSIPYLTTFVKEVMVASDFVSSLPSKDASHVIRKHATSAVILLKLQHIPPETVGERAQHTHATWRASYRTEQCARHATAFARLPAADKPTIRVEEVLRL
jgi:hypothetical protein